MAELDPVQIFVPRLNASGVRYMITGSIATITYGEIRHTNDVDIVLALAPARAKSLLEAFPEEEFYRPPLEVVIEEHKLEAWELGALVAQPVILMYRCLERSGGDSSERQNLYARICRLDPLTALDIPRPS